MTGDDTAHELSEACARMRWRVEDDRFALFGFAAAPDPADGALVHDPPAQLIREGGETTLLVRAAREAEILARHPEARVERDLCWIRFEAPMGWDLVGFLALVSGRLAEAGVPIGAVCGFSRDHLFVAEAHLARTREVLATLFPEAESA